jgi:23S rRNA (pseudouridine1915-N3)-methyltransferase
MQIELLCVARRPPEWVRTACQEYQQRMPKTLSVTARELPPVATASSGAEQREREGAAILRALSAEAGLVALDERGTAWNTRELAAALERWRGEYPKLVLAVGGAEGLSPAVLDRAAARWSLSALTLPHQLVRVIVIEQLYRAWTVLNNHPYHRG